MGKFQVTSESNLYIISNKENKSWILKCFIYKYNEVESLNCDVKFLPKKIVLFNQAKYLNKCMRTPKKKVAE